MKTFVFLTALCVAAPAAAQYYDVRPGADMPMPSPPSRYYSPCYGCGGYGYRYGYPEGRYYPNQSTDPRLEREFDRWGGAGSRRDQSGRYYRY